MEEKIWGIGMEIGSLLEQAEQCKSEKDAADLLKLMQKVFVISNKVQQAHLVSQ